LDGLAFIVFAILDHDWPGQMGIPMNTTTSLIAFSGLAALGTWKDIHGVDKFAVLLSLALNITLSILLTSHLREKDPRKFNTFIVISMVQNFCQHTCSRFVPWFISPSQHFGFSCSCHCLLLLHHLGLFTAPWKLILTLRNPHQPYLHFSCPQCCTTILDRPECPYQGE